MEREERLKQPDGWLSLVGLHWLKEGSQTLGCDTKNEIALPKGACPTTMGEIELKSGVISLRPSVGIEIILNGKPISNRIQIKTDEGQADVMTFGRLQATVIKRSKGYALRVKDPQSPTLKKFHGLQWFEIDPHAVMRARWIPETTPKTIKIPNILGGTDDSKSAGKLEFEWQGQKQSLLALDEGDSFFILLKDKTSGRGTYPAGRFLYAKKPKKEDLFVELDFNQVYNPPCAYTPFATCPLPPRENHLQIEIKAGEKYVAHE